MKGEFQSLTLHSDRMKRSYMKTLKLIGKENVKGGQGREGRNTEG